MTLLAVGIVGLVSYLSLSRLDSATVADQPTILAGSIGVILLSAIVPLFLSLAASALLQGVIVLNVMRAALGEKPTLPTLLRMARGRIWALIGWTLLVVLAVTLAFAVLVGIIVALAALGGVIGVLFAVLVGLGGGAVYLVLWAWLSTKLSLVASVLMAERLGVGASIKRSWALTRNAFWKTFGIELLVSAIIGIATQIVVTPISLISGFVTTLADPNSQSQTSAITSVIIANLVIVAVSVVFGAIGAVIQSSTVALIYIDLRMRKEGLDLDLAHFVEARQRSEPELSDPYLRHTAAADESPRA